MPSRASTLPATSPDRLPMRRPRCPRKEVVMRMPHVADRFFHRHKPDPNDPAPLFDSGIGDWLLDLTAVAMIALILRTSVRGPYIALSLKYFARREAPPWRVMRAGEHFYARSPALWVSELGAGVKSAAMR